MSSTQPRIVETFEREVTTDLRARGADLEAQSTQTTIATNSSLIEQRGRPLVQLACRELGKSDLRGVRVLDLGCGYGALAALFATEGASVVGLDADRERLEIGERVALEHGLDMTMQHGRMESPEVGPAQFELVLVNNSLCYLVDVDARRRTLDAAYGMLRPGGVIILRDPNRLHPRDLFTNRWLIGLLPPKAANLAAGALGRKRSTVRLRTPLGARLELTRRGFSDSRLVTSGGWLRRTVGGYNILAATRPT